MSYSPLFTSEIKVEALTRVTITESSKPTTAEVLVWIEEIETNVLERNLYSRTATDQYIDVLPSGNMASYGVSYTPATDRLSFDSAGATYVTLSDVKKPIIAISALTKNDNDPSSAASWDTLTAGPADGSSYMLLTVDNKDLGYCLYFYDNFPVAGPKRIKMTYTYGLNLDTDILSRYCTYAVGIEVLQARRGLSVADGLTEFTGGNLGTYVPTHYESRIKGYYAEMRNIEADHFPDKKDYGWAIFC